MSVIHFDANRGNDSNNGSTPALAKQTLATLGLGTARVAGFRFLLADDSVWEYDLAVRMIPSNWQGIEANPIVVGKYSPSSQSIDQRPVIRWNRRIAANEWVYDAPNNGWYYDAPHNVGTKCLVRVNSTWLASQIGATGGLPLDSVDGRYQQNNSRLHMYAPAGIDPTSYYGEVLLSTQAGFLTITDGRGWVQVEDLQFEDTCAGIVATSNTSADVGLIARRIFGRRCSNVVRGATGSSGLGQLYLDFGYCDIRDWGSCAMSGSTPTGQGLKRLIVHHNELHDGGHNMSNGALHFQMRSDGVTPRFLYNHVSKFRFGTRDKTSDGSAIYMETQSGGCEVAYNVVHDGYLAFQDNSGRNNNWHHNVAYNVWGAMFVTDASENDNINLTLRNNTFVVSDASQAPTFGSGHSQLGINCYKPAGNIMTITAHDNVFMAKAGASSRAAINLPQAGYAGDISHNAASGFAGNVEQFNGAAYAAVATTDWVGGPFALSAKGVPQNSSPLLTARTDNILRRDIRGILSRRHVGAYGAGRLVRAT